MKCSLNWLKKYIDLSSTHEEIAAMLTTIGLEVEGMEVIESIKGSLEGVVIGEVKECVKHPDADKLSITKVDIGQSEFLQIICGAPNVSVGQKVLVATVGCTLYPSSGEPLKIKKAKIRGIDSSGMICAADEIGMGTDHSGIMVLPQEAKIGTSGGKYFEITHDTIFEIGLTPNRSDATCHLGVARDLFAYAKINNDNSAIFIEPSTQGFNHEQNTYEVKVNLNRPDLCPRYVGVTITGVTVKDSPMWLKNQLSVLGIKSINNIVDITNFILHELGQPLHAFDADEIEDRTVNIDTLPKGYKFKALDGREFELTGEELMICNGKGQGMCIGGVYGGYESGVKEKTTNIFLEAAHFTASTIRRTSMYHNLRTDAAKVFEKGSDPNICEFALKRAAVMIVEMAGGIVSSEIVDIYPKEIKQQEIHVRYHHINALLGVEIPRDKVHDILNALGMQIQPVDDFGLIVFVPTNKSEVLREVDVIEEILRIYGFNMVSTSPRLNSYISYAPNPNKFEITNGLADFLAGNGLNEMMGLSLIDSKLCIETFGYNEKDLVFINNTSNAGLDVMRPSMLISGLLSVQHNLNRQQLGLKLFEIGKSYLKVTQKDGRIQYEEAEKLTIFMTGLSTEIHWSNPKPKTSDFFTVKQLCDQVLDKIGISTYKVKEIEEGYYNLGLSYSLGNNKIVDFGEVSDVALKKMGIKQAVYFAEFDLAILVQNFANKKNYVKEISKYPSVKRDLAIIVDKNVSFNKIEEAIKRTKQSYLKGIGLFDIYTNEAALGKGKKSYALNFIFENLEKTLTDKEIEESMTHIINVCETELGGIIRK
jgi:phenylalanyl-tRNA synthetase beta chain